MEGMPDLQIDVLAVTLDRVTGRVELDYQGINYLEAIGMLTVALNQIQEVPFDLDNEYMEDEDDE